MAVSGTIVLLVCAVLMWFGIKNQHHHGYMAFVAIVLGMMITKSVLAGPANQILNGLLALLTSLPSAIVHAL